MPRIYHILSILSVCDIFLRRYFIITDYIINEACGIIKMIQDEETDMAIGISRDAALELLKEYVKNQRLISHCLATEAVCKTLAIHFNEDADKWAMAGLLHDLDAEITNADLNIHGKETTRILSGIGVDPEIIDAIAHHNEISSGETRTTRFQHALAAGETITGLITATALIYPDKKLSSVKPSSVVKRMKEKAFAASVNRDIIMECEGIGIPLAAFAEMCVKSMQSIGPQLGL
jgi:putative nucleotidyltransferase with HDIG domain